MNYIDQVIVPISADPIDPTRHRVSKLAKLEFDKDLEINIIVDIHEVNGQGVSLFDIASTKEDLTPEQRLSAQEKYFPKRQPPYTTKGSLVDSSTGQISETGDITEKQFLFSITFGQLKAMLGKNDNSSVMEAIMEFAGAKMQEINARGRN